eukprot:NODE_2223_length_1476_cov_102.016260_g2111_i0.p1 GENE.NODE_2223_length_1476_cov_102.016260_g2111_i0~~NODE_2223_length_1476_cov_102.016260_g2111_i0.p1  ORF type:complete len:266 (+),score=2.58 NODE_2223_length_1476_cov_102.016260_g2111_i0:604-1401(+)
MVRFNSFLLGTILAELPELSICQLSMGGHELIRIGVGHSCKTASPMVIVDGSEHVTTPWVVYKDTSDYSTDTLHGKVASLLPSYDWLLQSGASKIAGGYLSSKHEYFEGSSVYAPRWASVPSVNPSTYCSWLTKQGPVCFVEDVPSIIPFDQPVRLRRQPNGLFPCHTGAYYNSSTTFVLSHLIQYLHARSFHIFNEFDSAKECYRQFIADTKSIVQFHCEHGDSNPTVALPALLSASREASIFYLQLLESVTGRRIFEDLRNGA